MLLPYYSRIASDDSSTDFSRKQKVNIQKRFCQRHIFAITSFKILYKLYLYLVWQQPISVMGKTRPGSDKKTHLRATYISVGPRFQTFVYGSPRTRKKINMVVPIQVLRSSWTKSPSTTSWRRSPAHQSHIFKGCQITCYPQSTGLKCDVSSLRHFIYCSHKILGLLPS